LDAEDEDLIICSSSLRRIAACGTSTCVFRTTRIWTVLLVERFSCDLDLLFVNRVGDVEVVCL